MAFMGETTDVGVAELLSVLARRGHTGRLHINAQGEEVQVVLNGGKVTQVSSSHHSLRIGRVLVRMGVLKDEDLNEAIKEQISLQISKPLGQILTSYGLVTQGDLARAAEEQATDALSRVFGAQGGTFYFTGLAAENARPGLMALNAEGIVLEASRRADEIEALRQMMPADEAVLTLDRSQIPIGDRLPEHELRVVRLLGMEAMTLPQLLAELADDERAVLRAIVGLRERGIVAIRHSSQVGASDAVEEVTIAPRRAAGLRQLIGADHRPGSNAGIPGLAEIRAATQAGTQTVARATRVVREVVGAFNAGLPLLAFAHFTDDYFRRLAPISDEAFARFERLGTPDDDEHQTFIDLRDVRALADGRISGIAVTSLADDEPTQKVVVFAEAGDRVLIDAIVEPGQDREQQTQTRLLHPTTLFGADRASLRRTL
jgi:hypothetical protein